MTHRSILDNSRSAPAARRSSSARDRGAARAGFRPGLEPLEDRCLLSGNVVTHWNEILI